MAGSPPRPSSTGPRAFDGEPSLPGWGRDAADDEWRFLDATRVERLTRHAFGQARSRSGPQAETDAWAAVRNRAAMLSPALAGGTRSRETLESRLGHLLWGGLEAWARDYLPGDFVSFDEAVLAEVEAALRHAGRRRRGAERPEVVRDLIAHLEAAAESRFFHTQAYVLLCQETYVDGRDLWAHLWP